MSYGSSGLGSMSHVGMEFVAVEAKVQLLHVPYKGLSAVLTNMVGGNIETAIGTFSSAAPLMKSGAVRGLVVTGTQRSPFAPDIPTAAEAGLPGFRIDFWWGLMAPAKVPSPILKRLNEELNAVLQQTEVRDALAQEAAVPKPGTAEDFGQLLDAEVKRWSKLIKDANIKME